jgi:UDP-N-acetylmuramate dehydrogenase
MDRHAWCTLAAMVEAPDQPPAGLRTGVPLAPLTTLELGGAARYLAEVADGASTVEALHWAGLQELPVVVLGGGSNVVVADRGIDGLVLRMANRGREISRQGDTVLVRVAAGEAWDDVVAWLVEEDCAGVECLSGIPGSVGAAPIQNVGAYGQELAEVVDHLRVIDQQTLEARELDRGACGFGYRTSRLRREPGRFVVLEVGMRLRRRRAAAVDYPELARALEAGSASPTIGEVRAAVLELRRSKSMVIRDDDPNRRSVGSFFINPVLNRNEYADLLQRVGRLGITETVPGFPAGRDGVKVPAGWLIERSGFQRGHREGSAGLSSKHALALVHHGGGTAADLVALAREIRDGVAERFGIRLLPEPVFLGFSSADPLETVES